MYYSILFSVQMYIQWKDNPTITTIDTVAYPIKNVEFPAITICSQGSAKDVLDTAILKQFERYLKSRGKIKPKDKQDGETKLKGRRKRSSQNIVDTLSKKEVDKVKIYIDYT